VSALVERLRIFSGLRAMGDPCAWGSDAALFEEAAAEIERLEDLLARLPQRTLDRSDFFAAAGAFSILAGQMGELIVNDDDIPDGLRSLAERFRRAAAEEESA
jgi:hypothetical protein